MRIASRSIFAAFAVTASAAPVQNDANTALQVCDVNNQVWNTGSLFEIAPVSRSTEALGPDIDTMYGTPKNTPKAFEGNSKIGPAGGMSGSFKESDHFRVYGSTSDEQAAKTLAMMEASYDCFVHDMKWRTSGLSYNSKNDDGYSGPFYKENIFGKSGLGTAAGVMYATGRSTKSSSNIVLTYTRNTDMRSGLSYVQVISRELATPRVTVHEVGFGQPLLVEHFPHTNTSKFGHALTYHEKGWVGVHSVHSISLSIPGTASKMSRASLDLLENYLHRYSVLLYMLNSIILTGHYVGRSKKNRNLVGTSGQLVRRHVYDIGPMRRSTQTRQPTYRTNDYSSRRGYISLSSSPR